jgi:hypothetical protein
MTLSSHLLCHQACVTLSGFLLPDFLVEQTSSLTWLVVIATHRNIPCKRLPNLDPNPRDSKEKSRAQQS